jgi:DNA polymerase bacteriophage-type
MKAHLDFETFSEVDLPSVGHMRYGEDRSTEVLIASYCIDDGPIEGVDLTRPDGIKRMERLFNAVSKGAIICSHNAQFERRIWEKRLKHWPIRPKAHQWSCTSARASAMSLPSSLEAVGVALGLPNVKDPIGKSLINKFSNLQKDGSRIRSTDDPKAFQAFVEYCKQDTIVERNIDAVLPELTDEEQKVFALDYKINAIGVPLDIPLIHRAIEFIERTTKQLEKKAKKITGVKTSQRDKLLEWVSDQGAAMSSMQAAEVERAIADPETPVKVKEILLNRMECTRAGTKKLQTMLNCVSDDGRVKGAFWYCSASTGRWGSSRVQFHNFQKPDDNYPQDEVLHLLENNGLELIYDRPLTAIAKSIRGFIKAPDGREMQVADYAAIEARALAWLADEKFLLEAFRNGEDVYVIMASKIFRIPINQIDKAQRFFGKQTVLGAGYGMGVPKFIATCARFGVAITEREAKRAINGYRQSVPKIAGAPDSNGRLKDGLWSDVEKACIRAVLNGKPQTLCEGKLTILVDTLANGFEVLYIVLPSGRKLCYPQPRVENIEKWGHLRPTLIFKSLHRYMWIDEETYGGKLVENIVQAITRDLLAEGMLSVDKAGLSIIGHVHDEIIAETDIREVDVKDFENLVCATGKWSKTLPNKAEGKTVQRYCK